MKAGRELDDLIAEKVMGWKYEEGWVEYHERFVGGKSHPIQRFRPSRDISDAWIVVEKLHEKGFLFEIQNSVGAGYSVRFCDRATAKMYLSHYQENAPFAICLSALKAVGVEID